MSFVNFSPSWFFGYDVALELAFAVISIIVALVARKIYHSTSYREAKLLSASFSLIGVSYLIQSILNFLIISKANEHICRAIRFQSIALFNAIGFYVHMLFMTAGLVVLAYMTFRVKNAKIFWLLLIITLLGIFASNSALYVFFLFSTIYLTIISWHFIVNYLKRKSTRTLLIAVAFLFLLFGSVHFIFSVNHLIYYAVGHILELFAYLLILANLYLVLKR